MESTSVYKRKTGRLIAKNLIILFVLLAVAVLSIWAWFTKGQSATADGINVRTRAEGVDVSWDDTAYYKDLTAITTDDVVEGKIGLAKNVGNPEQIKLITGNGTQFFEPYLNRRIGKVLTNADGSWQGFNITESSGKYVDIDLHFRGTSAKDIYLAGDSRIFPKSTTNRISDYGPFSKDYICAASRVAFLDSTKQNCSFIWAPNADYELKENEAGYTRYTTTATEEIKTSTGGSYDLEGFECSNKGDYYFWTLRESPVVSSYAEAQTLSSYTARPFTYDTELGYYTVSVTTYIPKYDSNPTIPFFINQTQTASSSNLASYNEYVDGAKSNKEYDQWSKGQYFQVTNSSFTIDNTNCANGFRTNAKFTAGTKITFKLAYNPETKCLVVLNYVSDANGSFSRGEEASETITYIKYYPLDGGLNCTLVNPDNATAISTGEHNKKAVQFKDSTAMNVLPVSITLAEQFTVEKTGDTYQATYKFKNAKTGRYLTVSNGTVSFTTSGSSFELKYIEGYSGPALKSGDYYVVIDNGYLSAVTSSSLDNSEIVTVYTGSSYEMLTNVTNDSQIYQYYAPGSGLVNLNSSSTPKLFTSTSTTAATVKIGNTKVATLTKENEDDEYYTAHIVMRIWVEGTDRDALTPLADGIFNASFHFIT